MVNDSLTKNKDTAFGCDFAMARPFERSRRCDARQAGFEQVEQPSGKLAFDDLEPGESLYRVPVLSAQRNQSALQAQTRIASNR
jgi:hypothetical protein